MKIVIDIDNETYGRIQALVNADYFEHDICGYSMKRIANGTPYEERPQGEWIVQRLQNGFDDVYCPYCKARPRRSDYGYYLKDNFCYKCGADLRVKNELEEVEND